MSTRAHNVGWSMQQVDAEAAFIARTAAYAAGLSVSEWLHQLVLEHSDGQDGDPPTPVAAAATDPAPVLRFTMDALGEPDTPETPETGQRTGATPLVFRRPEPSLEQIADDEPVTMPDLSASLVVEAEELLDEPVPSSKDGLLVAPLRNVPEERPSRVEPPRRLIETPAPSRADPGLDDDELATLRAIISRKDPDPIVAARRPRWGRLAILPALIAVGAGAWWALSSAPEDPAAVATSPEAGAIAEVTLPPPDSTTLARPQLETLDVVAEPRVAAPVEEAVLEDLPLPASQHVGAYRQAAGAGDPDAQFALGQLYAAGDGVKQDYVLAAAWYRAAAESNIAPAQLALGKLHVEGLGIDRDPAEAAIWFRRAARQDLPTAKYELGHLYWQGDGVTQDRAAAFHWLRLAEADGFVPAKKALTDLMPEMSAAEISRGEALLYDQPTEPLPETVPAAGGE